MLLFVVSLVHIFTAHQQSGAGLGEHGSSQPFAIVFFQPFAGFCRSSSLTNENFFFPSCFSPQRASGGKDGKLSSGPLRLIPNEGPKSNLLGRKPTKNQEEKKCVGKW